mgnify:CR=1 FL=1
MERDYKKLNNELNESLEKISQEINKILDELNNKNNQINDEEIISILKNSKQELDRISKIEEE